MSNMGTVYLNSEELGWDYLMNELKEGLDDLWGKLFFI
jgi:hypothetical protein